MKKFKILSLHDLDNQQQFLDHNKQLCKLYGGKGIGLNILQQFCKEYKIPKVHTPRFFIADTNKYQATVDNKIFNTVLIKDIVNPFIGSLKDKDKKVAEEHIPIFLSSLSKKGTENFSILDMGQNIEGVLNPQVKSILAEFMVATIKSKQFFEVFKQTEVGKSIDQDYKEQFGNTTVAVRSSGTLEDGQKDAAAGLYKTKLGVKGSDDVLKAYLDVLSSQFAPKVFVHRVNNQQSLTESKMACVIQELFEPENAGVMFSCRPSNPDEFEVNFGPGLGEFVVGSHGKPASISLNHKTNTYKLADGEAKYQFKLSEEKDHVVKTEFGQNEKIDAQILVPYLDKITALLINLEKFCGFPVDVEFGIKNGEIALLQVRPITVFGTAEFEDLSDITAKYLLSNNMLSSGLVTGEIVYVKDPSTFDFSTLPQNAIICTERFCDEIEANINSFKGFICLQGGELDHGSIVMRQHHIPAMQIDEVTFGKLIGMPITTLTLVAGKIGGNLEARLYKGDYYSAIAKKRIITDIYQPLPDSVAKKNIEIIRHKLYPKKLGEVINSIVELNTALIRYMHPYQGGNLGRFLDMDPMFFIGQEFEAQQRCLEDVSEDIEVFFRGLDQMIALYQTELNLLNSSYKEDEKPLLKEAEEAKLLLKSMKRIKGSVETLVEELSENPKLFFREKIAKIMKLKAAFLALSGTQKEIIDKPANEITSAHEIILKIHRNMFNFLSNARDQANMITPEQYQERQPGYKIYSYMTKEFNNSWQKQLVTKGNLVNLRAFTGSIMPVGACRSVILTDENAIIDMPIGMHSIEITLVNDSQKGGGDSRYLGVRLADNDKPGSRIRQYLCMKYLEKVVGITDIVYEEASRSIRFKISDVNYDNPQNKKYFIGILNKINKLIEGTLDIDNDLNTPEYQKLFQESFDKADFLKVMSGQKKLCEITEWFIAEVVKEMMNEKNRITIEGIKDIVGFNGSVTNVLAEAKKLKKI